MTNSECKFLKEQIRYVNDHAEFALNYHYYNILDANERRKSFPEKLKSNYRRVLHNEIISYLNWLGRIKYFSENMKERGYLKNNNFKDDFKIFRDKLAAHEAITTPKHNDYDNESYVNLEISANFGRAFRFSEGQPFIQLEDDSGNIITFRPAQDHENYIKSLNAVLSEIKNSFDFN